MTQDERRLRESLASLIAVREANGEVTSGLDSERRRLLARGRLIARPAACLAARVRSSGENWGRAAAMGPHKLLVVDHDPTNRDELTDVFVRNGWEVCLVMTLARGLTVLSHYSPDWVIVASQLPGGSGEDIFRMIRAGDRRTQVAIVTEATDSPRYVPLVGPQPHLLLTRPVIPEAVYGRCMAGVGSSTRV